MKKLWKNKGGNSFVFHLVPCSFEQEMSDGKKVEHRGILSKTCHSTQQLWSVHKTIRLGIEEITSGSHMKFGIMFRRDDALLG